MTSRHDSGGAGSRDRAPDERLAAYVDDAMTERERARFEGELRVNPQLKADLEDYERTVRSVRSALQAETAKVDLADRIFDAIDREPAAPVALANENQRGYRLFVSMAAAAALLVLAVWVNSLPMDLAPESAMVAQGDAAEPATESAAGRNKDVGLLLDEDAPGDLSLAPGESSRAPTKTEFDLQESEAEEGGEEPRNAERRFDEEQWSTAVGLGGGAGGVDKKGSESPRGQPRLFRLGTGDETRAAEGRKELQQARELEANEPAAAADPSAPVPDAGVSNLGADPQAKPKRAGEKSADPGMVAQYASPNAKNVPAEGADGAPVDRARAPGAESESGEPKSGEVALAERKRASAQALRDAGERTDLPQPNQQQVNPEQVNPEQVDPEQLRRAQSTKPAPARRAEVVRETLDETTTQLEGRNRSLDGKAGDGATGNPASPTGSAAGSELADDGGRDPATGSDDFFLGSRRDRALPRPELATLPFLQVTRTVRAAAEQARPEAAGEAVVDPTEKRGGKKRGAEKRGGKSSSGDVAKRADDENNPRRARRVVGPGGTPPPGAGTGGPGAGGPGAGRAAGPATPGPAGPATGGPSTPGPAAPAPAAPSGPPTTRFGARGGAVGARLEALSLFFDREFPRASATMGEPAVELPVARFRDLQFEDITTAVMATERLARQRAGNEGRAQPAGTSERYWLVAGPTRSVRRLMQDVAKAAQQTDALLGTGEVAVPLPARKVADGENDSGKDRDATGVVGGFIGEAAKGDADRMQLVLRFRVVTVPK